MFEKPIVVDGRGHLIGRLASIVAKELLCGQKVVVTRCEQLEGSGSLFRAQVRFQQFLNKAMLSNPKKGPIHHRSPARVFWRTVRGMLPHKTQRGQQALHRLKAYEGIPAPYSSMKRMVCADALRITRLKPFRKYYSVGELCSSKGWKFGALVERLEANRKEGSAAYYEKKKAAAQESSKAAASACASIDSELAAFGY